MFHLQTILRRTAEEPHPLCCNGAKIDPADTVPTKQDIVVKGLFDGDDGGGGTNRFMVTNRNKELFKAYMKELGFNAKFEVTVNGRIEIIGAHFCCLAGYVDPAVPWTPAFSRYIDKFAVHVGESTPATRVARLLSLSDMFDSRIEPVYDAFMNLAKAFAQIADMQEEVDVALYSAEALFLFGSYEELPVRRVKLCDFITTKLQRRAPCFPPVEVQIKMINNSVFCSPTARNGITAEGFARLQLWSQAVVTQNDAGLQEAAYMLFPRELLKTITTPFV